MYCQPRYNLKSAHNHSLALLTSYMILYNVYFLGHLQFRLKDSQEACPTFKCAILSRAKPTPSEWITCCRAEGEIGFEHFTYHKLTDSDESLSTILAKYSTSNICGLIIINSTNSISLSDNFDVKEGDILVPPVYVVPLEDGCELEKFIGARGKESVLIRVVVDSNVDMPVDHDAKISPRMPQSLCFCSMYPYINVINSVGSLIFYLGYLYVTAVILIVQSKQNT